MTPPWSPEAESSLLARLLIDPGKIPLVQARLGPEDFYAAPNRAAFAAMCRLSDEGRGIDLAMIRDEAGIPDLHLGVVNLTAGHSAPLESYADLIRRDAFRRRYIDSMRLAAEHGQYEGDPHVLIADAQERIASLAEEAGDGVTGGAVNLRDYEQPPEPPLLGVLSPEGTTILYGDGGDGKGWVAARWAASLGGRVAIIDFEMHPGEWAHRLGKFGVSLDEVLYFSPTTTFDQWANEQSARMLRNKGVGFLVIDSAMYASNVEDPYSPNGALAYGRGRRRLDNLPALLLAHTTGGADKVFGSVFWRNESRIVWRLSKDSMTRQRQLECRKANNYSELEGRRFNIDFSEERGILELHEHGQPWVAA